MLEQCVDLSETKKLRNSAVVGIDMGATHTRVCLLDRSKNILDLLKIKTADLVGEDICAHFQHLLADLVGKHRVTFDYIVIGLPVTISKDKTRVLSTSNLQIRAQLFSDLVKFLQMKFACGVELERDVNLQLAYDVEHARLNDKIVLGCYLGTGFGFSIWLNGELYTGAHGVAGELGHIPYGNEDETCVCGNPGCLETVVSGMNLRRFYEKEQRNYPLDFFFEQQENHAFIQTILSEAAKAIATTINLFDPDAVIIGGGVVDMQGFPYQLLKEKIMVHCRKPLPAEQLELIKATSSASNGAKGAAFQALSR